MNLERIYKQLASEDEFSKCLAIEELGVMAVQGYSQVIPTLIEQLHSSSMVIGETAALSLINCGTSELVETLIYHLNSNEALFRNRVAEILKMIGGKNINVLINGLYHSEQRVRIFCLEILAVVGRQHPQEKKLVDVLCSIIRKPELDGNCKAVAIEALGKIGNIESIVFLRDLFGESQSVHQFAIIGALSRIGNNEAKQALQDLLIKIKVEQTSMSSILISFINQVLGG